MTESYAAEDRMARGEATEPDYLLIIKRLGEDLLEAKDALVSIASLLDAVVVYDGRNVMNIVAAQQLAQRLSWTPTDEHGNRKGDR